MASKKSPSIFGTLQKTTEAASAVNGEFVRQLRVSDLEDNPMNRFSMAEDEQFLSTVESVKKDGFLEDIIVTPAATEGKYRIVSGHRRVAAARKLGKTTVPCKVRHYEDSLAELRALRLGKTDCVIPTFAEALEALGGRVPLLLEVKRGHDNRRLCALTLEALRTYTGPYCVESFDPTIVAWFRRNAPDILRGQLSQPPKEYGTALSKPAAAIVGNVLTNGIARPQFIAYKIGPKPLSVRLCEAMGAVRAGWTSRAWTHERDYDIVIFEHYRPGAWFRADI